MTAQTIVFSFFAVLFLVNVWATVKALRFAGSTLKQKPLQILVVWLLPFIGSTLLFSVVNNSRATESDRGFKDHSEGMPIGFGAGDYDYGFSADAGGDGE